MYRFWQKFFLLIMGLLVAEFAYSQCPKDSKGDKNIGTPGSSYSSVTIHTGDVSSISVINGAIYEFSMSSNPFETDEMHLYNKVADGIYSTKWETRSDYKSWQSDFDGDYWFTITDQTPSGSYQCGYNSTSAVIKVRQSTGNIDFTSHPNNAKVNCGETASFSVSAKVGSSTSASLNYQWQKSADGSSFSNISGATNSTYTTNVTSSDFGTYYRCKVSIGVDNKTSNAAQVLQSSADPPSGISASQDRCDGIIDIEWEWYQPNPGNFKIQRSTNNISFTDLATVSGSKRKYQHSSVTRGVRYYYRIASYNDACGSYGEYSDSEWGTSPLDPDPPRNSSVSEVAVDGGKGVQVTWTDNSDDETGFIISRSHQDGTNLVEFEYYSSEAEVTQTGATRSFTDKRIENCQAYTYRVYSFNTCNNDGVLAEDVSGNQLSHDITVVTDIEDVLFPEALATSKGYYSNKTSLKWEVNSNSNFTFADRFKIYVRELGTEVVPELISIVDSDIRQYDDETSDAGKLYEYFVVASGDCGSNEILSFDVNDLTTLTNLPDDLSGKGVGYNIGFRSPSGIVNGNITYSGGVAVPDVKVVVEREDGNSGNSLSFDGVDDYVAITNTDHLEFDSEITLSLWLKPDRIVTGERTIIDKSGIFRLAQVDDRLRVVVGTVDISVDTVFELNQYKNITLTYDQDSLKVYVNGKLYIEHKESFNLTNNGENLFVGTSKGKSSYFDGLIDEVRLHHEVLSHEEVLKSFGRLVKPNYPGISAYWRLNEAVGPFIFDLANTGGTFHQNDGRIYGAKWSQDIPDGKQLGMAGFTDDNGNYSVTGISYTGTGENFTVTPKITLGGAVHEFSPLQKVLFIGEGSSVQNEINFTDVSSFRVTGFVRYKYDGNVEVGVEGVRFLIDGETYVQDSDGFMETDANGFFDIQVPIGHHFIQAQKAFHDFEENGRWPNANDTYDFQDVVSGIVFEDTTTRKVIGRVVGGLKEGNKKVGFGYSINNIGAATFKLEEASGENLEATITADINTGEFEVRVPPMRYIVYNPFKTDGSGLQRGINVNNNAAATLYFEQSSLASDLTLDLRNTDTFKYEIDSTYNESSELEIDSVSYHSKHLFVYRSKPQVDIYDGKNLKSDESFTGEGYFVYTNKDASIDSIDLNTAFADPVIFQAKDYALRIEVSEQYERFDVTPTLMDTVPVSDAEIEIFNQWGKGFYLSGDDYAYYNNINDAPGVLERILLSDQDGDTTYVFKAASPEFNNDASFADQSFTKSLQVTVKTKGNNPVYWPVASDVSAVQNAYVLGAVPVEGSSFVTQGPDVVDFILRDPPGDGSSSMLERGSTVTKTSSFSFGGGQDVNLGLNIGVSVTTWVGFGAGIINESEADATVGLDLSYMLTETGERVTQYTATETFQTSEEYVGPDFDLFVGKSENVRFGISQTLSFVPSETCGSSAIECVGPEITSIDGSKYRLGSGLESYMNPTGEATLFAYTAWHIKNTLIPNIELLRNNVLNNNDQYLSNLPAEDENYGRNNDDPVFGSSVSTATPTITEDEDFTGVSYVFTPGSSEEIDSVRWLNQQIRLWEKQLLINEKEKVELVNANRPERNISYSGGTTVSYEETSSEENSETFEYELAQSVSAGTSIDMSLFGVSMELEMSTSVNLTQGGVETNSTERSTTYGYTINDADISDYFNVKVFPSTRGNGPVFQVADGGVTVCPHEDGVETEYYLPGTVISTRTLQADKPRIGVDVPILYNIPADETGNYVLTLYNDSEIKDDAYYEVVLVDETNPNGLKLSIDGAQIGGGKKPTFLVPGGSALQKVLEISRGPFEYDYEDIQIVLSSTCQNDATDVYDVIADTVSISAFFLPQCTTPEILSPKDNWVANSNINDTLTTFIGGFNINYSGFESVNFEYKSSSQSTWSLLETFYRDTTGLNNKDAFQIPRTNPVIEYDWLLQDINDENYDIRAVSKCFVESSGSYVFAESEIYSGIIDRVNPHPFGAPQPSDGILSSGDEIMIQFNEEINSGLLRPTNFSISGVLNGGDIRHSASMRFEGDSNHYMEIPYGIDLKRKSFTIDFYLARVGLGEQIVVSQGFTDEDAMEIGFRPDNKVYFRIADKIEVSQLAITDDIWRHYAFVYDHEKGTGSITLNGVTDADDINNDFSVDYTEEGQILIGKAKYDSSKLLDAKVHEFRIWNKDLTDIEIGIIATKRLERNEFGLIGNWRMEEGEGNLAEDHIRFRNATIKGNWALEPSGYAYDLSYNGYLTAEAIAYSAENDFTIEFWFKRASSADSVTLISTGIGDSRDSNISGWAIGTDTNGQLVIANNGDKLVATDVSVLDNSWHHLALSVNRITNTNVFIDGSEVASYSTDDWIGFGGSKIWIGCRGWFDGATEQRDQYFNGGLDEIRIWSKAKSAEMINLQKGYKLTGSETGLAAYYPFESFEDNMGVMVRTNTLVNQQRTATDTLSEYAVGTFIENTPPINLPRPVQAVNFNYSANGDKIILSPIDPGSLLEGVVLDISVSGVKDMNGNAMSSTVGWTAYYNQNAVLWENEELDFSISLGEALEFETLIINSGGSVESFTISNIPEWLTVSPSSGTLNPLSSQKVTFTVDENISLGDFAQDIYLTSGYGYDERLMINLSVTIDPPTGWTINPPDFEYSMGVVGKLKIGGKFSQDDNDMVAAFVDNECRGITNMKYVTLYDQYYAYLNIYSNQVNNEVIELRVWDASDGVAYAKADPSITFSADSIIGSSASPITIETRPIIQVTQEFVNGWQWVSFNVSSSTMSSVNDFMSNYNATDGDIIKYQGGYEAYDSQNGWIGKITANGGFQTDRMYKFKLAQSGALEFNGQAVNPSETDVKINTGWNWISFLSQRSMSVNEAMANYNAKVGDRIKSQFGFAIYEGPMIGWVGSLTQMNAGEGYMLKATDTATFKFPDVPLGARLLSDDPILTRCLNGIDVGNYQFTMSVVAQAVNPLSENDIISIYHDQTKVGYGLPRMVGDKQYLFFTIYGNGMSEELILEDQHGDRFLQNDLNTLIFRADEALGTLSNPLLIFSPDREILSFKQGGIGISPVPFDQTIHVRFASDNDGLNYELVDLSGLKVQRGEISISSQGYGTINTSEIETGVYFIKLIEGGELVQINKIIKN